MVLDLLTNPDRFFERRANDPGWLGPFAVVLLAGVLGALAQIPMYQALVGAMPESAGTFLLIFQVIGSIVGIVVMFVIWLIVGVLLYVTANIAFGAEGDIWGVVKLSGWGFVPNVLGALVNAVVFYSVFAGTQFPNDPQRTQQMIAQLQSDPLFLVSTVAAVVLLLWSGLLWAFAARHSLDLSFRRAVLTAAVPVGLGLLFQLVSYALSGLGGM